MGYQVKALFKMIDTDGSGDIDIDELITFVWGKEYTSAGAKVCAHICIGGDPQSFLRMTFKLISMRDARTFCV